MRIITIPKSRWSKLVLYGGLLALFGCAQGLIFLPTVAADTDADFAKHQQEFEAHKAQLEANGWQEVVDNNTTITKMERDGQQVDIWPDISGVNIGNWETGDYVRSDLNPAAFNNQLKTHTSPPPSASAGGSSGSSSTSGDIAAKRQASNQKIKNAAAGFAQSGKMKCAGSGAPTTCSSPGGKKQVSMSQDGQGNACITAGGPWQCGDNFDVLKAEVLKELEDEAIPTYATADPLLEGGGSAMPLPQACPGGLSQQMTGELTQALVNLNEMLAAGGVAPTIHNEINIPGLTAGSAADALTRPLTKEEEAKHFPNGVPDSLKGRVGVARDGTIQLLGSTTATKTADIPNYKVFTLPGIESEKEKQPGRWKQMGLDMAKTLAAIPGDVLLPMTFNMTANDWTIDLNKRMKNQPDWQRGMAIGGLNTFFNTMGPAMGVDPSQVNVGPDLASMLSTQNLLFPTTPVDTSRFTQPRYTSGPMPSGQMGYRGAGTQPGYYPPTGAPGMAPFYYPGADPSRPFDPYQQYYGAGLGRNFQQSAGWGSPAHP